MTYRNQARRLLSRKQWRDNRTYTYEDIVEATGLSSATISAVLNNKLKYYDMSENGTVAKFCNFLDCTLAEFFGLNDNEDGADSSRHGQETTPALSLA